MLELYSTVVPLLRMIGSPARRQRLHFLLGALRSVPGFIVSANRSEEKACRGLTVVTDNFRGAIDWGAVVTDN